MDVLIVTGSKNDLGEMEGAVQILKKFGISYEMRVSSAHRTLKRTLEIVESAEKKGVKVIIAAAGMSAPAHGLVLWKVFYSKPRRSRREEAQTKE